MWYGWPDYTGGLPVTNPRIKPEGKPQPSFLLAQHPMQPPRPVVTFTPVKAACKDPLMLPLANNMKC